MADAPLTYSIDACDEAFVRDFCPYKGSPDPVTVWRAAWSSAMAATPSPPVAAPPATPVAPDALLLASHDAYMLLSRLSVPDEQYRVVTALAAALHGAAQPQPQPAQPLTRAQYEAMPAETPDKARFWAWWEPYQLPDGWIARLDLIAWHAWQAATAQRESYQPSNDEIDLMARAYLGDCGPQATRVYSFVRAILSRFSDAAITAPSTPTPPPGEKS